MVHLPPKFLEDPGTPKWVNLLRLWQLKAVGLSLPFLVGATTKNQDLESTKLLLDSMRETVLPNKYCVHVRTCPQTSCYMFNLRKFGDLENPSKSTVFENEKEPRLWLGEGWCYDYVKRVNEKAGRSDLPVEADLTTISFEEFKSAMLEDFGVEIEKGNYSLNKRKWGPYTEADLNLIKQASGKLI